MRLVTRTYDPANVDTDGLVDGGTGASLALLASGAGDGLAHRLNFTSAQNISDHTFTVVGTDENGLAISEVVTGPNATTVESTSYFLTVTSITPNATLSSDTVDIGWVDKFVTPAMPCDHYKDAATLRTVITGTIDYTIQMTLDPLSDATNITWSDVPDTVIDTTAITTGVTLTLEPPPTALRIKANSYTDTAEILFNLAHTRN